MERRAAGSSNPGPYGQACMQCFKSKCRCVALPGGQGCERCARLNKQCTPSDSIRRRNAQKNTESSAQIANLEGKLNALISVVQSVAESAGISADIHRTLSEQGVSLGSDSSLAADSSASNTNGSDRHAGPTPLADSFADASAPNPCPVQAASAASLPTSPPHDEPSEDEAEQCLGIFRSRMLPCFPFIDLPLTVTVHDLRRDRPLLLQSIVAVASPSTRQKLARAEVFRSLLAHSVIVKTQSNIDLLLGVLTYLTWSTDPFLRRGSTLTHLMMLAISLVYDLGLVKPTRPDAQILDPLTKGMASVDINVTLEPLALPPGFLEQQRAVLACFLLSSSLSSYFGLIDAIRWTPQMEEALRVVLANRGACPSDEMFALQIQLQLLIQQASHFREQHEADFAYAAATSATPVPSILYMKALRTQLQELRDALSPELRRGIIVAYIHYTELCINEIVRPSRKGAPVLELPGRGGTGTAPGLERIECMWRSVDAIKSWLDVLRLLSPSSWTGLPFHFWTQLVRCFMLLKHFSVLDDPAWDCGAVYRMVNMLDVMDWMSEKVRLASIEAGEQFDDDIFRQFSKMLRLSRVWLSSKIGLVGGHSQTAEELNQPQQQPEAESGMLETADYDMIDQDQMAWLGSIDFANNRWLEDMFSWSSAVQ